MKYELDNIYNIDCYTAIKELPDKSVDCIYTDVPYLFADNGRGHSELANRMNNKKQYLSKISKGFDYSILDEFVRVMRKVNCFIWCSKMQLQYILNYFIDLGCNYEILVWCKSNPSPTCNNICLPDIEYCLYFRESGVKLNDGYELKSKWFKTPINKADKDIFDHPTIKPFELVKRHLLHSTLPKDIILDPFLGSGTTAVVAKEIGRKYIGFEIEKRYFTIATNRLDMTDNRGQMRMFLR